MKFTRILMLVDAGLLLAMGLVALFGIAPKTIVVSTFDRVYFGAIGLVGCAICLSTGRRL